MPTLVVNLFGGPGSGKSTGAAYVFARLKMLGYNAELVTEFAKDKTWEKNETALAAQDYITAKQHYRLRRCAGQVDVVITDSPLLLGLVYLNKNDPCYGEAYKQYTLNIWNTYNNLNYFLARVKEYNPAGRNQTEAEADGVAEFILKTLNQNGIEFQYTTGDMVGYDRIVEDVIDQLKNKGD